MKVFNLRCAHQHVFEGWFGSEDDYLSQCERGLLECPLCASTSITRMPSAPRINLGRERAVAEADVTPPASAPPGPAAALQSQWVQAVQQLMANTDDVGDRFADEARRIHYGEAQERAIRGHASAEDAKALRDEGIEVVALPVPEALKRPLQ
jgi:hypothetical protein